MSNTNTDLQNGVGPVAYEVDRDGAYLGRTGKEVTIEAKTAAYTLSADMTGRVHTVTSGSGVTVTLPNNLPVGFTLTVIQGGAGQVTFSAASGATLSKLAATAKTTAQYAVVRLHVIANSDNASAQFVLSGDVAAS